MKIESIEIKNFKAITAENIATKGHNVYVMGANGTGKTSFIDAIFKTLTGEDLPSKLVKQGEEKGSIKIDLGKYIVEADFNAKKEKMQLTVSSPEGASYKSPRTMLDEVVGTIDFDINNFFSLTPKKQVDLIKGLVGIDFTDLDEQYKELFDERTFVNRQVKELEAQQVFFDKSKSEPIDITKLQAEIQKASETNANIKDIKARFKDRALTIESLKKQLAELENLNERAAAWLEKNSEVDITELQQKFNNALEYNKAVEATQKGIQLASKLEKALADQAHLNARLQEIEATKKRIISDSQLPVEGLTFDDNQLYLNGLPFERNQINTAQQIIAGLQINMAMMKDVRIARFDGSLLDNKSLAEVEAWAEANNLQLFVEMVDRAAGGMQVVVSEEKKAQEVLA
jgi:DNA repair exonuclease SbcCD ATPase subunit